MVPLEEYDSIQEYFQDPGLRFGQLRLIYLMNGKPAEHRQCKQRPVNTAFLREGCSERTNILSTSIVKLLFREVVFWPVRVC